MEKKIKILYAEDEEIVAKSMIRMLSIIADIDYAKDGLEAFNLYEKNEDYDANNFNGGFGCDGSADAGASARDIV